MGERDKENELKTTRPVALVTGSSSLLGEAICLKLARAGYDLALHYQKSFLKIRKLEKNVRGLGVDSLAIRADLKEPKNVIEVIRKIKRRFNRLDLLVNNASLFFPTPPSKESLSQWERIFQVNLFAPYFLSQAASSLLKKNNGCILNLTDIYGENPILKDYGAYCLSKAALISATRLLAKELGPEIRVNGVSPGAVKIPKSYNPVQRKKLIEKSALQKQGKPEDIAEAVFFLTSQKFITGQILRVDGGRFLI